MNLIQKIQTFYLRNSINLEFGAIVIDFWIDETSVKADKLHRDWGIDYLRVQKKRNLKHGFCMMPAELTVLRIMEKLPKKKR